jgi:hypothetical protein
MKGRQDQSHSQQLQRKCWLKILEFNMGNSGEEGGQFDLKDWVFLCEWGQGRLLRHRESGLVTA